MGQFLLPSYTDVPFTYTHLKKDCLVKQEDKIDHFCPAQTLQLHSKFLTESKLNLSDKSCSRNNMLKMKSEISLER